MTTTAFERFETATRASRLAAYVVTDDGRPFARIVFSRSASNLTVRAFAARLDVWSPMVDGIARGGGYDRKSAALADAMRRLPAECAARDKRMEDLTDTTGRASLDVWHDGRGAAFIDALSGDDGRGWDGALRAAGFGVLDVV